MEEGRKGVDNTEVIELDGGRTNETQTQQRKQSQADMDIVSTKNVVALAAENVPKRQ